MDAFLPSPAEIADVSWLLQELADAHEAGRGVLVLPDGRFVDQAMAGHARTVVALGARRAPRDA